MRRAARGRLPFVLLIGCGAVHLAGDEPFEVERDGGESQAEKLFENRFSDAAGQKAADLPGGNFDPRGHGGIGPDAADPESSGV